MLAGRQSRKHESRRISVAGSRKRATTSADYNRLTTRAIVICQVRLLASDSVIIAYSYEYFFLICIVGGEIQDPLGTAATNGLLC
jgi:hypothetical protein